MNLGRGVLCSLLAAAVAVGLWALLSHLTAWQLQGLAVLVGLAAGFGMAAGTSQRGSTATGVVAGLVAFVAVIGGKYAAANITAHAWVQRQIDSYTHDDAFDALQVQVFDEFSASGTPMTKVESEEGGFPPEVVAAARRAWDAMSPDEREAYRQEQVAALTGESAGAVASLSLFAFIFGFKPAGLALLVAAVGTAWKLGCANSVGEDQPADTAATSRPVLTTIADAPSAAGDTPPAARASTPAATAPAAPRPASTPAKSVPMSTDAPATTASFFRSMPKVEERAVVPLKMSAPIEEPPRADAATATPAARTPEAVQPASPAPATPSVDRAAA